MNIFPFSEKILLPLAPTIASTIADYVHLIIQACYLIDVSIVKCTNVVESPPEQWLWQVQRSIRQIPTSQYQYVSTIAHQLAAKSLQTPLAICQSLHHPILDQLIGAESAHIELYCWYNEAGYIYLQISPKSIEIWLNYIHDLQLIGTREPNVVENSSLDLLLDLDPNSNSMGVLAEQIPHHLDLAVYAHARCCSILKLAHTEKLVQITIDWQIISPKYLDIPKTAQNPPLAKSSHIFQHHVEQRLITALMAVLDGIHSDNWQLKSSRSKLDRKIVDRVRPNTKKTPLTRLTLDLAQSWLEFHRHCRMFGDLKIQDPQLAIARCWLTAISRRYLQVLLEHQGIKALMEL